MKAALLGYATGRFSDPTLEFGPRWVDHHKRIFGNENIFVIGNHVDSALYKDVNFVNRNHPEGIQYDVYWELAMFSEWIPKLRNRYFCLFVMSLDEFLCLEKPLDDVVDANLRVSKVRDGGIGVCRVHNYDIVHNIFEEPALHLGKPTLKQRKWWAPNPSCAHPAIFYSSLAPAVGLHSLAGFEPDQIPMATGCMMTHHKREDFVMYLQRTTDRRSWKWDPMVWKQIGLSSHNRMEGQELNEWFFHDVETAEPVRNGFLWVP